MKRQIVLMFCLLFVCVDILFYLSISFTNLSLNPFYWSEQSRLFMSGVFVFSPLLSAIIFAAIKDFNKE